MAQDTEQQNVPDQQAPAFGEAGGQYTCATCGATHNRDGSGIDRCNDIRYQFPSPYGYA